jgi:hypothetical protein
MTPTPSTSSSIQEILTQNMTLTPSTSSIGLDTFAFVRFTAFDTSEVIQLLNRIQLGIMKGPILTTPPINVRGGEVYIYQLQRKGDLDYLRDHITGFRNNGVKELKRVTKTYYKLKKISFAASNKQYVIGFEKHCFTFSASKGSNGSYVLIHYLGDETLYEKRLNLRITH